MNIKNNAPCAITCGYFIAIFAENSPTLSDSGTISLGAGETYSKKFGGNGTQKFTGIGNFSIYNPTPSSYNGTPIQGDCIY